MSYRNSVLYTSLVLALKNNLPILEISDEFQKLSNDPFDTKSSSLYAYNAAVCLALSGDTDASYAQLKRLLKDPVDAKGDKSELSCAYVYVGSATEVRCQELAPVHLRAAVKLSLGFICLERSDIGQAQMWFDSVLQKLHEFSATESLILILLLGAERVGLQGTPFLANYAQKMMPKITDRLEKLGSFKPFSVDKNSPCPCKSGMAHRNCCRGLVTH